MATRQINNYAGIVFNCSGSTHRNTEMIVEEHCIVRVLSGELKVIQSDKTYLLGSSDTLLFPRNQLSTLIKSDKDGLPYRAAIVKLTQNVLRLFYEQKKLQTALVSKTDHVMPLPWHPLLNSFLLRYCPIST